MDWEIINLTNESKVVNLVCIEEVLDDKVESVDTTETVDTVASITIDELKTVRAEVDRVFQSLQRVREITRRSKPSQSSPKINRKKELAGLIDGLASMGCAKRRRL